MYILATRPMQRKSYGAYQDTKLEGVKTERRFVVNELLLLQESERKLYLSVVRGIVSLGYM